jgi:hypothetical protein
VIKAFDALVAKPGRKRQADFYLFYFAFKGNKVTGKNRNVTLSEPVPNPCKAKLLYPKLLPSW